MNNPLILYPLDPHYPITDKQEAERALAALYQPTYSSTSSQEHNNRVLGGYRATLANPNVSEAAKAHARAMLEQAGADVRTQKERSISDGGKGAKSPDAHLARQLGGYKSALKSEHFLHFLFDIIANENRPKCLPRGKSPRKAHARSARNRILI